MSLLPGPMFTTEDTSRVEHRRRVTFSPEHPPERHPDGQGRYYSPRSAVAVWEGDAHPVRVSVMGHRHGFPRDWVAVSYCLTREDRLYPAAPEWLRAAFEDLLEK